MLSFLWYGYLYQPLFNVLIWIYNHGASHNLGWAVIWLTIYLRLALLPFTIISERNAIRHERAVAEARAALAAFKGDAVAQRDAARKVMKKYRISPWAKVVTLGVQALVLVLLYQVFVRGISGERIAKLLYQFIDFPGKINTIFYGFEIGQPHDSLWAGLAALYLFISIFLSNRRRPQWDKSELYYILFFPLFTFAALWYLPMVKSLFILTTMIFSDTIKLIGMMIFFLFAKKPAPAAALH